MPPATPPRPRKQQPPRRAQPPAPAPSELPEVVDPRWLLQALAITGLVGLACAYIALCILFAHAQWQLVLHPSRTEAHHPADFGLRAEDVRFGPDSTGQPQLRGWWVPASSPAAATVLMLPSGDGEASALLGRARSFHDAGLNALLFDPRGFGPSGGQHPTQSTMEQDSEAALAYITGLRGAKSVLLYGNGAGASLAVRLAAQHGNIDALVLEAPQGDFAATAAHDTRARIVPFHLLFNQNFPLAQPLAQLHTPRMIVTYGASPSSLSVRPGLRLALPGPADETDWQAGLRRFLDTYVPQAHTGS